MGEGKAISVRDFSWIFFKNNSETSRLKLQKNNRRQMNLILCPIEFQKVKILNIYLSEKMKLKNKWSKD